MPASAINRIARRCRGFIRVGADSRPRRKDRGCSELLTGPTPKMNRVPGRRWVLGPRKRPGIRSYIARVLLRRQEGQIIPGLVMILAAIVIVGMLFLQVGRAADFSSHAQAGADAAALAAARNVKQQLERQVAATGMADIMTVDPIEVRAAAEEYAALNHVRITGFQREGADVRVWVATDEK